MDRVDELETQVSILQRRCEELEIRCAQAETSAEKATIEANLKQAAVQAGFQPGAAEDVASRAMREEKWKIDSTGAMFRVREDGKPDVATTGEYVPATAWMQRLAKRLPSYTVDYEQQVVQSNGAGQNPWSPQYWNLTQQGQVIRDKGMDAAQQMAAAVGSAVNAIRPKS